MQPEGRPGEDGLGGAAVPLAEFGLAAAEPAVHATYAGVAPIFDGSEPDNLAGLAELVDQHVPQILAGKTMRADPAPDGALSPSPRASVGSPAHDGEARMFLDKTSPLVLRSAAQHYAAADGRFVARVEAAPSTALCPDSPQGHSAPPVPQPGLAATQVVTGAILPQPGKSRNGPHGNTAQAASPGGDLGRCPQPALGPSGATCALRPLACAEESDNNLARQHSAHLRPAIGAEQAPRPATTHSPARSHSLAHTEPLSQVPQPNGGATATRAAVCGQGGLGGATSRGTGPCTSMRAPPGPAGAMVAVTSPGTAMLSPRGVAGVAAQPTASGSTRGGRATSLGPVASTQALSSQRQAAGGGVGAVVGAGGEGGAGEVAQAPPAPPLADTLLSRRYRDQRLALDAQLTSKRVLLVCGTHVGSAWDTDADLGSMQDASRDSWPPPLILSSLLESGCKQACSPRTPATAHAAS
jgi:hypothetical protein